MASLVDSELSMLMLAEHEKALGAISDDAQGEICAYALAVRDLSQLSQEVIAAIIARAFARAAALSARFDVALEAACIESERRILGRAPPQ